MGVEYSDISGDVSVNSNRTIPFTLIPNAAAKLSVVKRPDGRRQVAYKGGPLYTFDEDKKAGDMNGDGFKDVGTWHVVAVAGKSRSTPASSGGYSGYSGGY